MPLQQSAARHRDLDRRAVARGALPRARSSLAVTSSLLMRSQLNGGTLPDREFRPSRCAPTRRPLTNYRAMTSIGFQFGLSCTTSPVRCWSVL